MGILGELHCAGDVVFDELGEGIDAHWLRRNPELGQSLF